LVLAACLELASGGASTVVEHMTRYGKIAGLNPAKATWLEPLAL